MARQMTVTLIIPAADIAAIAAAISAYAHAAYPPGGSECAQVSRQTLLDTAAAIAASEGQVDIRRRQLAMLRAAISWYFDEDGPNASSSLARYLQYFEAQK